MLRKRVVEPRLDEVLPFCSEDPVERVFLEDSARRGLGRFVAVRGDDGLDALCHVGANLVPAGSRCELFAPAAARAQPRMVIGHERAVGDLWDAVSARLPAPRDDRPGQPVYVIDERPPAGETGLRAAKLDDLDVLLPACAVAHEEEIGIDPLVYDADGFRWRTRALIEEGRSWLWREGDTILFKAEASAWTPSAVQLQQVWVDPPVRRRGHGSAGLRDLMRLLLDVAPAVCLFVRQENDAGIRLYESIGMRRVLTYRSLLF
ncbi:MAG TPA: GNAT family N-acetyltransferase [Gaiellaceae bacterium]|nr:GNAT family N-acetyltransferase [Gaiellaceae bacterium]